MTLDATHDPKKRSWVESANSAGADFPLQNLPLGVAQTDEGPWTGIAIGDQILDLPATLNASLLDGIRDDIAASLRESTLNRLMSLGRQASAELRLRVFELLEDSYPDKSAVKACLVPQEQVRMLLPCAIGDYTDFYASIYHATNVGRMFRPDNPLLPNYKWVPIGYHGRASSIVASGAKVHRPAGQAKPPDAEAPMFGPAKRLDYELEVGVFIGSGNELSQTVPIHQAEQHAFGMCLVNDWSARDIQAWEYQPLGPFLAKNFLTTISPWVVTLDALAPFRAHAFARPEGDPRPLPYLRDKRDQQSGGLDIQLEVWLRTAKMCSENIPAQRISRGNFRDMYWTIAQMITHHASNGCNLQPGDLLASGTVSGAAEDSRGCLLELTRGGAEPLTLASGEQRKFLEDGDEVVLRGYCEREGAARIGFGECRGTVVG